MPGSDGSTGRAAKTIGLCRRCEWRASFYEEGIRPRYECGDVESAVWSCYMYKPVRPVVTERNKGDRRPAFAGAMISARSHAVRVAEEGVDVTLSVAASGRGAATLFWKAIERRAEGRTTPRRRREAPAPKPSRQRSKPTGGSRPSRGS